MPTVAWMYPGRLVATFTSQLSSVASPPNLHVNSASHSPQSERRGRGGSVIKSELTGSRVIEGGRGLVIFFEGKMSPLLPSGSHPGTKHGREKKKKEKKKKPLSCAMTVTAGGDKSLSAYSQPVIALSITDYKCTPHGLVLFGVLHHVAPSSLNLRPAWDTQRNSRLPASPPPPFRRC